MMSGGAASWFVQRLRARRHLAGSRVESPSASGIPCLSRMTSKARGSDHNRPEPNSPVRDPFPPPPQVTDSARLNLSRWRHGFEPRWDYERKVPGQRTNPEAIGLLNRDSNAGYPENIPSRIVRGECAKERPHRGWIH
jgi:hypothetical protein